MKTFFKKYLVIIPLFTCMITAGAFAMLFHAQKQIAFIQAFEDAKTYLNVSADEMELALAAGRIDIKTRKDDFFDYWIKWDFSYLNETYRCIYAFAYTHDSIFGTEDVDNLISVSLLHDKIFNDTTHKNNELIANIKDVVKNWGLRLYEDLPKYITEGFDPLNDDTFLEAIFANDKGEITIPFNIDGLSSKIFLYYRWTPAATKEYLCIVGIVPELIDEEFPIAISLIIAFTLIITTILNFGMIAAINRANKKT